MGRDRESTPPCRTPHDNSTNLDTTDPHLTQVTPLENQFSNKDKRLYELCYLAQAIVEDAAKKTENPKPQHLIETFSSVD